MDEIYHHPELLLQKLIQFDTTNPPGNEAACIAYIDNLLKTAGFETTLIAKEPARPNLLARLKGRGTAAPLLLQGHVDVVTTANQEWRHPPFSGHMTEDMVWGRGALDMKGGVAMMVSALLQAKAEELQPAGDIILLVLSDEEASGNAGARFLVTEHPELFADVRYAIGEFGGAAFYVGKQKFYPIQVAEKQICWLKLVITGPGGHGAMAFRDGTMAMLGTVLQRLNDHRLPVHITPVVHEMLATMATVLPQPTRFMLRRLLNPVWTDRVLDLLGHRAASFDPMLHNTVNATMVHGGEKGNVIPSQIVVNLDGRLLPGFTPSDMLRELNQLLGGVVRPEIVRFDAGPNKPDMGQFPLLTTILHEMDPTGISVPMVLPGVTDGRFFAQLGIQTYGFLPLDLKPDDNLIETVHAADERVPIAALQFGTRALLMLLQRYGYF